MPSWEIQTTELLIPVRQVINLVCFALPYFFTRISVDDDWLGSADFRLLGFKSHVFVWARRPFYGFHRLDITLPPPVEDPWLETSHQVDPVRSTADCHSNCTIYHSGASFGHYYSSTPGPNEQYFDSFLDLDAQPRQYFPVNFQDRPLDEAMDMKRREGSISKRI